MTNKVLPLLRPDMPTVGELIPFLSEIDRNHQYTNFGPLSRRLESSLEIYFNDPKNTFVQTVSNCTVGIEMALKALGLAQNSLVLIPSLTFAATGTAVVSCGFTPVFSDIDSRGWVLTPNIAMDVIKSKRVGAVIPVATFGLSQDVAAWDAFSTETGIPVIIDAASAFGNQDIGSTTSAVFSLHATKSLGSGEGGFVASRNKPFIEKIKQLTNFGIVGSNFDGYIDIAGTNGKMSEYHSAVALASLLRWGGIKNRNIKNYYTYLKFLEEAGINFSIQEGGDMRNHTLLPIRFLGVRDVGKLSREMLLNGIETRRWYYPLLPDYACFTKYSNIADFTNARQISEELLGLPFYPSMSIEEIKFVVDSLKKILK